MFIFEKFIRMYGFAVVWGLVIATDFVLRMMGLAGYHGIQTGVTFPFAAPILSGLVLLAFVFFLTSRNRNLSKKVYASFNYMMLMVLTSSLLVDFTLRFVAFD